jgi:hypothetical protein
LGRGAGDLGGESLLVGATDDPDREAHFGKARRKRPIGRPSLPAVPDSRIFVAVNGQSAKFSWSVSILGLLQLSLRG